MLVLSSTADAGSGERWVWGAPTPLFEKNRLEMAADSPIDGRSVLWHVNHAW